MFAMMPPVMMAPPGAACAQTVTCSNVGGPYGGYGAFSGYVGPGMVSVAPWGVGYGGAPGYGAACVTDCHRGHGLGHMLHRMFDRDDHGSWGARGETPYAAYGWGSPYAACEGAEACYGWQRPGLVRRVLDAIF
jgi:hypothetical protein